MGSPEGLEGRVSALETEMSEVRVLAEGADRDVSVLASRVDGQTRLLQALRETQIEDHERLAEHDRRFDRLEREMRRGFATLAIGQAELVALLTRDEGASDDPAE